MGSPIRVVLAQALLNLNWAQIVYFVAVDVTHALLERTVAFNVLRKQNPASCRAALGLLLFLYDEAFGPTHSLKQTGELPRALAFAF